MKAKKKVVQSNNKNPLWLLILGAVSVLTLLFATFFLSHKTLMGIFDLLPIIIFSFSLWFTSRLLKAKINYITSLAIAAVSFTIFFFSFSVVDVGPRFALLFPQLFNTLWPLLLLLQLIITGLLPTIILVRYGQKTLWGTAIGIAIIASIIIAVLGMFLAPFLF